MTSKEYLGQAYRIDQRINSKLEQVASLRDLATKTTVFTSDMPHSATRNTHPMEAIVVNMVDLEHEVNADIDALVDLKRDIMRIIKTIQNPEYQILLELRYLCFRSWEEVAVAMGYDLRYLHKLHGRALDCCTLIIQKEDTKRH